MKRMFLICIGLVVWFSCAGLALAASSQSMAGEETPFNPAAQNKVQPGVLMLLLGEEETVQPGETWTEPVTGMEFVWVPEGCYDMGCGDWTDSCYSDELPVHEVCLDGFWMGKYEVTQGQWAQIVGENPSYFDDLESSDRHPVEQVSWYEVQDFIAELNSQGSSTFRLPTEAEWEYPPKWRSGGEVLRRR